MQWRHFNFFLGGGQNFVIFFNATWLLKNWKKQHFICSNLTFFIVPFFLFSLFSLFPYGVRGDIPQFPQMTPLMGWNSLAAEHLQQILFCLFSDGICCKHNGILIWTVLNSLCTQLHYLLKNVSRSTQQVTRHQKVFLFAPYLLYQLQEPVGDVSNSPLVSHLVLST